MTSALCGPTVAVVTGGGSLPGGLNDPRVRLLLVARGPDGVVGAADVVVVDFADCAVMARDRAARCLAERVTAVARLVRAGRTVLAVGVPPTAEVAVVRAGVRGFLPLGCHPSRLPDTVCELAGPGQQAAPRLSTQERVVLVGYASGLTLTAAARRAGVRPATAKKYLDRVKQKYADCGRATYTKVDLAVRAREDGLFDRAS